MTERMEKLLAKISENESFAEKLVNADKESIVELARKTGIELSLKDIDDFAGIHDCSGITSCASYKPGAHRHGWVLTLSNAEIALFKKNGYKLVTNFWYSKGDFFEVIAPDGTVLCDISQVLSALEDLKTGRKIDYAKWMGEIYSKIKLKDIWNIAIPGTHDSGIFSSLNTIIVRNQSRNIKQQLKDGIRMFDLRICCADGEYYMAHNNHYAKSQLFFEAVKQIKDHLDANKKEIVIATICSQGSDHGLNANRNRYIHEEIKKELGDYLVPQSYDCKISNLVDTNKRAIFISEFAECTEDQFKDHFWPDGEHMLHSTWKSYQSDFGKTIDWKVRKLENELPGIMNARGNFNRFYKVDLALHTINIYNSAKYYQHPLATRFFAKNIPNCDKSIFIIDFYEEGSFVSSVVKKNILCSRAFTSACNKNLCSIWGTKHCVDGIPVLGKCSMAYPRTCGTGKCALHGTFECVDGVIKSE